jgi:TetR/AcrR family transcriptional repressor of nem operon
MIKTRGRPKAFDEDEVLASAMNYFWEHGYSNASLDNLLVAMGIKKSSFYHTFGSKEELFSRTLELYRKNISEYLNTLKKDIGAKATMLMLTELTIKELRETGNVKGCLLVNSGQECYNKYKDLSRQIKMEFSFMQELFTAFIAEAQSVGEITSTKEAKVISGRYMNSLNGLIVTIQAGASDELIDDIVESLREILE